ncbi:MAG: tripartite tricarboxylate transporter permease [Dehalococcoidales bacterium]|nr:tripartite tricarboxylate transporter permease [Dehalococcoidales bacterium]
MEGLLGVVEYLSQALTPQVVGIIIIATIAGLIMGALPGISPTLAVALLVPFTFWMDAAPGLIMLGAVYTSAVAGGAMSAILINVPGAPAAIATLFDGYPMAKQGHSQKALNLAFVSTFIGGTFGMLILITLTPPLAEFALRFGFSEMFWVAIFGVTVMASLTGESVAKGLISGVFGLLLGIVGMSPIYGVERFVFTDVLAGGVHVICALIGLFAIPQVFDLVESMGLGHRQSIYQPEKGIFWKSVIENIKKVKTWFVGMVIGVIIGIIPGAGGQIAGLVSYDWNKRLSKHPETFGKGDPDGVIAAQSSNSAMCGGSLIPLLCLGIPGSPTAAVLFGGLLINGLFPGPDIMIKWAPVTYTFMGGLLISEVFLLIIGLATSRYSTWIMNIPNAFMAVGIIVLAVIGTYSIQTSFNDVIIMAALGFIMYIAMKAGFAAAPMVLGVILGPIAENNFGMGMIVAGTKAGPWTYFFTGQLNIILVVLCIGSMGVGLWMARRTADKKARGRLTELIAGIIPLGLTALMYLSLKGLDPKATLFPSILLALCGFLSLAILLPVLWQKSSLAKEKKEAFPFAKVALFFVCMVGLYSCRENRGFLPVQFSIYLDSSCYFGGEKAIDTYLRAERSCGSGGFHWYSISSV